MTDPLTIAEDAWVHVPPLPSETLHDAGDVVLIDGVSPHYTAANAQRIRFRASTAERRVDEVRAWYRRRGRERFIWVVGPSATPAGFGDLLLARGAVPDPEDPVSVAMVLTAEPPAGPADVVVRRVDTLDDFRRLKEASFEAFGTPAEVRAANLARIEEAWVESRADGRRTGYLALLGDRAVAFAWLIRLPAGPPYLGGGGTIPSARGRGAYRALVRARWDEAVRIGTPALIVQAGAMSRPVLERLGFRGGGEILTFLDAAGEGVSPAVSRPPSD